MNSRPDASIYAGPSAADWLVRFAAAVVIYLLVAGAFSPGYIALSTPLHSDLFRYFEISQQPFDSKLWASPRPLMLAMLRVLDTGDFGLFHIMLLAVSVLLPVFMLAVLECALRTRIGKGGVIAFLALCYVLPSFYELAPLDFGGALSGIVACIAVMVLAKKNGWASVIAYALLTWVSLEFKPSYAFVLCLVPIFIKWGASKKEMFPASAAAFLVSVAVFMKDRWLGSSFVGVGAASGGSYELLGKPAIMFDAGMFYAQRLFSLATWLLIVACAVYVARRMGWRPVVALAALALMAIVPLLLIPNHRFVMYAWYPASVLLLLVPLAASQVPQGRWRAAWLWGLAMGVLLSCWSESRFLTMHRSWYVHNQQLNANVIESLRQVQAQVVPGERVLISGRLGPYVPYKNDAFIGRFMPQGATWTVVTPPSEDVLIAMSPNTKRYVPMSALDGAEFDKHIEYDQAGRIDRISRPDPAIGPPGDTPLKRTLLFCSPAGAADAAAQAACLGTVR